MKAAKTGLKAAEKGVTAILSSPWFWVAVFVLVSFYLSAKVPTWWKKLTKVDNGSYANHATLNDADIARLQTLAHNLKAGIYNVWSDFDRNEMIGQAVAVNDSELKYLATFYRTLSENSLYDDLDNEWFLGDEGERLMNRLQQIAMI